jgi:hypothetical protein
MSDFSDQLLELLRKRNEAQADLNIFLRNNRPTELDDIALSIRVLRGPSNPKLKCQYCGGEYFGHGGLTRHLKHCKKRPKT